MRNWDRLKTLTAAERKLLLQALVLLPVVHGCLKCLGYFRLVSFMEARLPLARKPGGSPFAEMQPRAAAAARMVSIAAFSGPYRAGCLRRSLVLVILLRRQGIEGELVFGTRRIAQSLEAHAWVEIQGIVINDHPHIRQQYTPLEVPFPSTQVGL